MKNLPRSKSDVSVLFKILRHRYELWQPLPESLAVRVVVTPDGVRPPSRHEGAPAGTTESHLGEGVGQNEAPGGQAVQVGRHHRGRTEVTTLTQRTNVRSDNWQYSWSSVQDQQSTHLKSSAIINKTFLS